MSRPMSTSPAASQPGLIDPLIESMIDFSDYDSVPFQSPSVSPATSSKAPFTRPVKTENTTPSLLSTSQPLSGPSHQYDLYKQQTGMVPGALASTLAVSNTTLLPGYTNFGADYLGLGNTDDVFDFNAAPSQGSMSTPDMDMEFDSPSGDPNFFFESTVNPSSIGGQEPSGLPSPQVMSTPTSNVGRLWPGMHQQAAMAKAQAQAQQQRQRAQAKQAQRPKSAQPSDPIVEQKISQLLNSMRNKASMDDGSQGLPHLNIPRPKKDEEDMDEDERLLASEEGKKLSSKERRQLRNKVSARAFRSRRKGKFIRHHDTNIDADLSQNTSRSLRPRSPPRSPRTGPSALRIAHLSMRTSACLI
jgi:bZIP-type transcription factor MBZ1